MKLYRLGSDLGTRLQSGIATLHLTGVGVILPIQLASLLLEMCIAGLSGDRLRAYPISSCGLRVDNDIIRMVLPSFRGHWVHVLHGMPQSSTLYTLAVSHLPGTSGSLGSAAEAASAAKTRKYERFARTHIFVPVAFETLGPVCLDGASLIASIDSRLTSKSGDPRETQFLFQRFSIATQRGNAAYVRATLGSCIPDYYLTIHKSSVVLISSPD